MSSLADRVRSWPWWQSDHWAAYCEAYDGSEPHRPVSDPSYVVDLSQEIKPRSGHRYEIRRQARDQHVRTCSSVEPMHRAHHRAAGRETRSQATWDLMGAWIKECHGVCVTNGEGAWAYVMVDPPGAYYHSAAGTNSHYLQFKLASCLQRAGFEWYELGVGHTPGIDRFKSGFANLVVEP